MKCACLREHGPACLERCRYPFDLAGYRAAVAAVHPEATVGYGVDPVWSPAVVAVYLPEKTPRAAVKLIERTFATFPRYVLAEVVVGEDCPVMPLYRRWRASRLPLAPLWWWAVLPSSPILAVEFFARALFEQGLGSTIARDTHAREPHDDDWNRLSHGPRYWLTRRTCCAVKALRHHGATLHEVDGAAEHLRRVTA